MAETWTSWAWLTKQQIFERFGEEVGALVFADAERKGRSSCSNVPVAFLASELSCRFVLPVELRPSLVLHSETRGRARP
jgi:hypothetical protein